MTDLPDHRNLPNFYTHLIDEPLIDGLYDAFGIYERNRYSEKFTLQISTTMQQKSTKRRYRKYQFIRNTLIESSFKNLIFGQQNDHATLLAYLCNNVLNYKRLSGTIPFELTHLCPS